MSGKRARPHDPVAAKMRTMQAQWRDRVWRGGSKNVTRSISAFDCWCGGDNGHDWPGKDEGAPHPR